MKNLLKRKLKLARGAKKKLKNIKKGGIYQ
jgi:hypothetical protein